MTATTRLPLGEIRETEASWTMYRRLMEEVSAVARDAIDSGTPVTDREELFVVGGREIHVSRTVTPVFDDEGGCLGAVEIDRDIGDRIERRERTEALETYQQDVLRDLQGKLSKLAAGDLTIDPSIDPPDADFAEVQSTYAEFTDMNDDLREVVTNFTGVIETLTAQAEEIAASSDGLSASSEEVTASIQEIDASADEMARGAQSLADDTETTEATVDETTWSQSTNVSKTWTGDRANATATISMNDRVVDVRNVEVRYNETTWEPVGESEYTLNGTDLTVQLGDVAAGSTTEVRATGSKVRVTDGAITVLDPSTSSATLNTRIQIDNAGPDFALSVDETTFANRVHYAENATWGEANGTTTISANGEQTFTLPNATAGAEATVRTWPIEVAPTTGQVTVPEREGTRTEPGIAVRGDGNSEVDYTFVDAADSTDYVLWSETDEVVRASGTASSPLTLSDDDSEETLTFRIDDGTVDADAGGGGGGSGGIGGAGPMVTNSSPFSALSGLLPGPTAILVGLAGIVGLAVVSRETGLFDEGTRSDAVADATGDVARRASGLLQRVLQNEIVVAVLLLGAGVWLLSSGVFTASERLIVSLGSVPVAMFLVLRQFDAFDFRVWAGSTIVVGVLGAQQLAPGVFETVAEEAGIIIVAGVILLGWRALSAWRAEANTPDNVTRLEIQTEDDDGS